MKSNSLYLVMVLIVLPFTGYTQLKVYDDNRVKIFGDRPTDDPNNDLTMQVYGRYGAYLANGRIGFGDYKLKSFSLTPFVGELGNNYDSDKLELCGGRGLYLTHTQGYDYNHIIGYMNWISVLTVQQFHFNTDLYAKGFIVNSDERFKDDVKPLSGCIDKLSNISGVSYQLKHNLLTEKTNVGQSGETEKERRNIKQLKATEEKMKQLNRKRIGFLAEEIQQVFPDFVSENEEGYLHVDYLALVPILVESIKEQQNQITTLQTLLKTNLNN